MTRKRTVSDVKSEMPPREGGTSGMTDRVTCLVDSGIKTVNELADIVSKVSSSVDSRRSVEADNAVKMLTAETDARKEDDRHIEKMAELEQERLRISSSTADKEANRSIVLEMIKVFREQNDYYLALSQDAFMDEQTTSRLDKLNDIISALTMELMKAI